MHTLRSFEMVTLKGVSVHDAECNHHEWGNNNVIQNVYLGRENCVEHCGHCALSFDSFTTDYGKYVDTK